MQDELKDIEIRVLNKDKSVYASFKLKFKETIVNNRIYYGRDDEAPRFEVYVYNWLEIDKIVVVHEGHELLLRDVAKELRTDLYSDGGWPDYLPTYGRLTIKFKKEGVCYDTL